jgi:hypothetical protein
MNASEASSFSGRGRDDIARRRPVTAHGFDMHTVGSIPLIVGLLLFAFSVGSRLRWRHRDAYVSH